MTAKNVYLVGMMAVGKTTIGRHLASRLGFEFLDTDQVIEQRAGADITWIFELEGEDGFRDREQQVIGELTARDGLVLATGGGAVLRAENRTRLNNRGCVVYLNSDIELLVERTREDKRRPLLQGDDVRGRIEALTTERGPLYESVAHFEIDVGYRSPKSIAADIEHLIRSAYHAPVDVVPGEDRT